MITCFTQVETGYKYIKDIYEVLNAAGNAYVNGQ